jgi:drug/metabolite transporter (DMT)-like permease
MKPFTWAGIALIVLGALALAFQGINYTRQKNVVDLGSIHVTAETQERISIPPVLGGLAVAGGIALVVIGARRKA